MSLSEKFSSVIIEDPQELPDDQFLRILDGTLQFFCLGSLVLMIFFFQLLAENHSTSQLKFLLIQIRISIYLGEQ